MRHSIQVTLTIILTLVLVGLAWFAGRSRTQTRTRPVVLVRQSVSAGSRLELSDLSVIELPADQVQAEWVNDLHAAAGMWTAADLDQGEILLRDKLTDQSNGIVYPGSGPGRRLMTIRVDAAAANGFWLAEGSRVDIHLVPGSAADQEIKVIRNIRILRILDGSSSGAALAKPGSDPLLCLDLSAEQAVMLAAAESRYALKLSVVNEGCRPSP